MAADAPRVVDRLLRAIHLLEDGLLVVLLAAMIVVAGAQIVLRNIFDTSFLWADPLLRIAVLWVAMIGAMVATRSDRQISIDALSHFLPSRWRAALRVVTDLFSAAVAGTVAWHAARLVLDDRAAGSMVLSAVPVWACEMVLPVAFGVIALRYLLFALRHGRAAAVGEVRS
ncbi:MAG: TRAP transporter small permease [Thermoanaerobaculales bacterium]